MRILKTSLILGLFASMFVFSGCGDDDDPDGQLTAAQEAAAALGVTWVIDNETATLGGDATENLTGMTMTFSIDGEYNPTGFSSSVDSGTDFFNGASNWEFPSSSSFTSIQLLDAAGEDASSLSVEVAEDGNSAVFSFSYSPDGGRVNGLAGDYSATFNKQ